MAKVTLDSIVSGFKSVSRLITNFNIISDNLNNKVLYRDNPSGEPNQMENTLDMNSNRIINLPAAVSKSEPVTLAQLDSRSTLESFMGTVVDEFVATAGQTVFSGFTQPYTPGANNIQVYVNGVKQSANAYAETSTTSITFSEGLEDEDEVEVIINPRPVSEDVLDSFNTVWSRDGSFTSTVDKKLKEGSVSVKDFGAAGDNVTDDTDAFNRAIAYANANGRLIFIPKGNYILSGPLSTLEDAGCIGFEGETSFSTKLIFDTENDCIISKGAYKRFRDFTVVNLNETTRSGRTATLRMKNSVYSAVDNIFVAGSADNNSEILLEQEYTGSLDDAYFLVHVGCWYNTFTNVQCIYTNFAAGNKGFGLNFYVNPNAINVLNPPGQPAGTYSGSCSNNLVLQPNIEGKSSNIRLETLCDNNTFIGGQMLGGASQIRIIDSQHNRFYGVKLNQAAANPINVNGARSARNYFDVLLTLVTVPPWSFGILSPTDVVRHMGDGTVDRQMFFTGIGADNYKFPASPSLSADVNTLDDYKEGTWTPTIAGGTTPGSHTYSARTGVYTKIGNIVHFSANISLSAKDGAMAGDVRITGLPYVSSGMSNNPGNASFSFFSNVTLTGGKTMLTAYSQPGTSYFHVAECGSASAAANLQSAAIASNTTLNVTGFYFV